MSAVPRGARYNLTSQASISKQEYRITAQFVKGIVSALFDLISALVEMPLVEQLHIIREYPQTVPILYFSLQGGILPVKEDIAAQFCKRDADAPDDAFDGISLSDQGINDRITAGVLIVSKAAQLAVEVYLNHPYPPPMSGKKPILSPS